MAKSDTSDARGVSQWRSIGRYPRKGSKAIHILAPKMIKKKKKDAEDKQKSIDKDQNKVSEYILVGFTPISIFRYEDTLGKQIEYEKYTLPDLPLLEKAKAWGIDVAPQSFQGSFLGYYKPGISEKIRLASPHESIFFHELSHAAHKKSKGASYGKNRAKEEIVAELSAQVLSQMVGLELESTLGNSYDYVKQFAYDIKKDIGGACMSVLSEVESVLKLILVPEE